MREEYVFEKKIRDGEGTLQLTERIGLLADSLKRNKVIICTKPSVFTSSSFFNRNCELNDVFCKTLYSTQTWKSHIVPKHINKKFN